jgi:hypothetical protein
MSETSPEGLAAVQATLAGQAQSVAGDPSAAGIYGDQAGASQPAVPIDMSAASAGQVDVEELLARLAKVEADREADRVAALPAEPEPEDNSIRADSNAPGWLHAAFAKIEARLAALEG